MPSERTALSSLPEPDRTLLWCVRAWVIGHVGRRCVTPHIEAALQRLGLGTPAVFDLDALMVALAIGARRTLEINCVCHDAVSGDERALLDVLVLSQHDEPDDAHDVLSCLVHPRAARLAADAANRLALLLAAAGHALSGPWRLPIALPSPVSRVLH